MKKNSLLGIFLISSFLFSQNYLNKDFVKTTKTNDEGIIKFASFKQSANISLNEATPLLENLLNLSKNNSLEKSKEENDVFGSKHLHFKHFYNGVEVLFNAYSVHSRNGVITSVNGNFSNIDLTDDLTTLKPASEILQIGLTNLDSDYAETLNNTEGLTPTGKLYILPKSVLDGVNDRYAYQFVMPSKSNGVEHVYMDANTGKILKKLPIIKFHQKKSTVLNKEQAEYIENIKNLSKKSKKNLVAVLETGNAETRYNGLQQIETTPTDSGYILRDANRNLKTKNYEGGQYFNVIIELLTNDPNGIEAAENTAKEYIDQDNNWTSEEYAATKDDGALEAHWAFSKVHDFFKNEYDRNGFDNENGPVVSFIHSMFGFNTNNALWTPLFPLNPELDLKGAFMFIGSGDYNPSTGEGTVDIFASMDIIAHEFSHGVDNAAGNLVYEREPGALEEGFADIWGATVEAKYAPEKQNWVMGDDIVISGSNYLRSLKNPKMFNQPNTYKGEFWADTTEEGCEVPFGENDNCGVHTNSGVLNYWYYLLVEGGSGINDNGFNYDVTGIGFKKAADLVYSTQVNYIQSQSQFADVSDFTLQEAALLYGDESAEVTAVKNAWCAVGVLTGDTCEKLNVNDFNNSKITVSPIPAKNVLNINAKVAQEFSYKIINVAGQIVKRGNVLNNKININNLPKGTYLLQLQGKNSKEIIKFIKN